MLTGEVLGNVVVSHKFLKQFIFVCPPFPPQNPHSLMELVTARRQTVGSGGVMEKSNLLSTAYTKQLPAGIKDLELDFKIKVNNIVNDNKIGGHSSDD